MVARLSPAATWEGEFWAAFVAPGAGHHKPEDLLSGYPNPEQSPSSVPQGPQPRGAGGSARCALCSRALWLAKLPQPCGAEAVCLQLDRSSASPACLLRFLILGVGLSKSRAEPPRDQGEAGGALSSKFLFFFSFLLLRPAHKAGL